MECLNCHSKLVNQERFCPHCGQSTEVRRLEMRAVLKNFFQSFYSVDSGFLYLLFWLPTKPGIISREYVLGKRRKYFNPFTFLVIIIGVTSFISATFNLLAPSIAEMENPVSQYMSSHINFFILLTVPAIGFFTYILFRKEKDNFAECLILSSYCSAIRSVFFILVVSPLIVFFRNHYALITSLYLLTFGLYYAWACCQFFDKFTLWYFVKGFLVMVFTQSLITLLVAISISIYYARFA